MYIDFVINGVMILLLFYILVKTFYTGETENVDQLMEMKEVQTTVIALMGSYGIKIFFTFFGNFYLFVYF